VASVPPNIIGFAKAFRYLDDRLNKGLCVPCVHNIGIIYAPNRPDTKVVFIVVLAVMIVLLVLVVVDGKLHSLE